MSLSKNYHYFGDESEDLSVFKSTVTPEGDSPRELHTGSSLGERTNFWLKQIQADSREAPSRGSFERFTETGRGWHCELQLKCVLVVSKEDIV